jgi:phosphatidate cytidylyltransferase
MSSNLLKRIIVALIGIPVLLFIIYYGGYYLYVFSLMVAILGSWELAAMLLSKNIEIGKRLATLLAITVVSLFQFSSFGPAGLFTMFFLFFLAASLKIIETGIVNYTSRLAMALLAAVYPGFFISFSIPIHREFTQGWLILLFVFVNMWLADTFAYGFGKWLGSKKLAPTVSPNKTWVGFFAAFPGGLIAALAAYWFFDTQWTIIAWIIATITATFFGQIGDLVESAIKRDCDVKDSSNLIPGHGGVLDRFDSLLFALPAVYFVFRIFS